jgi:uncharacterized protein (UPF0333 family)
MLWGVTTIGLRKDNSGQVSIDFLIGVTIFLLAFIFLISAIPSMFTPFQSNSDELTMMADRVAATMTENVLVYNLDQPSIIDLKKFDNYKSNVNSLYTTIGLDSAKYHIEVDLEHVASGQDAISTLNSLTDGSPGNQNVGQSRRYVLMMDSRVSGGNWPGEKGIMVVRIWQVKGT